MTITIKRSKQKSKQPKPKRNRLGFTNTLAVWILLFLAIGLIGGFYLAIRSIETGYTGALACWTVVFTPIGTAVSVVLVRIVDKSRDENTGANGEGIKFAAAKAVGFVEGGNTESTDGPPV